MAYSDKVTVINRFFSRAQSESKQENTAMKEKIVYYIIVMVNVASIYQFFVYFWHVYTYTNIACRTQTLMCSSIHGFVGVGGEISLIFIVLASAVDSMNYWIVVVSLAIPVFINFLRSFLFYTMFLTSFFSGFYLLFDVQFYWMDGGFDQNVSELEMMYDKSILYTYREYISDIFYLYKIIFISYLFLYLEIRYRNIKSFLFE